MNRTHTLVFGAALVAAMFVGGVIGATALARSTTVNAAVSAASPSPGAFKSNEDATHEKGESAAQETAENNGTFHPGGPGGGGTPNETAAHEAGETAAREAAENAAKASPKATP
ncbi:MAG: hypothetical protein ABI334_01530 [Candidatus Dormiibacterota bacterium]